ncbi:helix-turn-helix domain-containing protein [Xanthobacter autotrophicus]|uniref:helix-turn-helix domain-containing protein n=1 Tax=Xanthobacter TaxID=279 RepID=UPI0024AB309A|nr:helix-turn-helix domain-containing protein [Xanthobacter autotrophicus]MDI4663844.1 helix-turn-helix domain-containing protein [Xanthobacter autotrophicus]
MSNSTQNDAQAKKHRLTLLDKWKLMNLVMSDHDLSASARNLFFVLTDHYNAKTCQCDPSMDRLAARIGLSRRRTAQTLRELEQLGWVRTTPSKGARNSYDLAFERVTSTLEKNDDPEVDFTPDTSHPDWDEENLIRSREDNQGKKKGGGFPPPPPHSDLDITEPPHDPAPPCAPSRMKVDEFGEDFTEWFNQYPKREGCDGARREYAAARHRGATAGDLLNGVLRFAAACQGKEARFITMPAYWLRDGRWRDDPPRQSQPQRPAPSRYAPRGLPPASVAQLTAMVAASKAKAAYEMALNGGKPLPAGGF